MSLWLASKKMPERFSLFRPFAVSIWLVALAGFFIPTKNSYFSLTFLAAGQNEVFHIAFPGNEHWLVNAGRAQPSNQARWIVGPYLRREGLKQLKGVLVTDFSTRHTGSLETLLGNFSVASLGIPQSLEKPKDMKRWLDSGTLKRLRTFPLETGEEFETGEQAGFEILKETTEGVFLLIHYQGFRFLFVPTWNHKAIQEAVEASEESFVDVLILPGAGRPDPADWENILVRFFPAYVVMTSEKPALQPVLDSLEREEIPHFSISQTGALRFQIQDGRLRVQPFMKPSSF
jgi:beta-lactamase superfamily II metal-dependent hydrolase